MSDIPFDTQPVLDHAALDELKDMLDDALTEIVIGFLAGLDAEVQAIEQALAPGGAVLRAAAHSLKGSAGNLGARRLAALASAVEKAALAGDAATCQALVPGLRAVADDSRQALTVYLAQA